MVRAAAYPRRSFFQRRCHLFLCICFVYVRAVFGSGHLVEDGAENAGGKQVHSVMCSSSADGHGSHASADGHASHSHPYVAILFPFLGIAMGTATLHLRSFWHISLPYTMILFVEGILLGALHIEIESDRMSNPASVS
eukprot:gnl/TRDRNA2_/TRDRNA2_143455_c1_seq1.p1 gnl/TRDRNA2_/TRDRNA2_143455_c1~~gnl/TRDRNA2_/TRDRNA2_143455_c1_seq1.p1  ORF type:complete len:138 (+),score=4.52 gnl/TRDRNA2_/TRDRNA2_143455_c1_seq1:38-451(+)